MKADKTISWFSVLILAFCVVVLLFSVRGNGIWIDEGQTFIVINASFSKMINTIFKTGNAIGGMPLYFICEFCWCKIFGYSEYALRSMNLIFAIPILWGSIKLIGVMNKPFWMIILISLNPVLLYYMNEARPYVVIYACGVWCFYFLFRHLEDLNSEDVFGFSVCFGVGCAFHMMFIFMGIIYIYLEYRRFRQGKLQIWEQLVIWLRVLPFFLLLAIHYFHFVFGALEVNSNTAHPLASILQIGYYFAGLGGLGWSRNDLRSMNLAITPRIVVSLTIIIVSYILLIMYFLRCRLYKEKTIGIQLISITIALFCFIIVNIILKTRFWERHVIFLLPGISLNLAFVLHELFSRVNTRTVKVALGTFLLMYLLSGLNLIVMEYYQKDNYRGAVELARSFQPTHIFFQGDPFTYEYYGLYGEKAEKALESDDMIKANVNITNADEEMLDFLLDKTYGDTILILSEKSDLDEGNLYKKFSQYGSFVNSFSIVFIPFL